MIYCILQARPSVPRASRQFFCKKSFFGSCHCLWFVTLHIVWNTFTNHFIISAKTTRPFEEIALKFISKVSYFLSVFLFNYPTIIVQFPRLQNSTTSQSCLEGCLASHIYLQILVKFYLTACHDPGILAAQVRRYSPWRPNSAGPFFNYLPRRNLPHHNNLSSFQFILHMYCSTQFYLPDDVGYLASRDFFG